MDARATTKNTPFASSPGPNAVSHPPHGIAYKGAKRAATASKGKPSGGGWSIFGIMAFDPAQEQITILGGRLPQCMASHIHVLSRSKQETPGFT